MNILDRDLVRAINSGRSFALIGSGPSCDLGMPSWRDLADLVANSLTDPDDIKQAKGLILAKQYSKVFSLAEKSLGRKSLLSTIQQALARDWPFGEVYGYLVSWPFQSYLTTNFDDQLSRHLKQQEPDTVTRLNSQTDMQLLYSTATNVIFKIHGDLSAPEDLVLTYNDYSNFQQAFNRKYWRDTIFALLRMVDLLVIGFSASDPDFNEQLERANQIASPDHPVFMFASDIDQSTIDKYFIEKNIRIISYNNSLGKHDGLKRVLARYHPFIAKRSSSSIGIKPTDPNSVLASSMHLFTTTRLADSSGSCISRSCAALLLHVLASFPNYKLVKFAQLLETFKTRIFSLVGVDPDAIQTGLDELYNRGLVQRPTADEITIHPNGLNLLNDVAAQRTLIEEQFDNTSRNFLSNHYSSLTTIQIDAIIGHLKDGLIGAYQKRGMEIARSVFSDVKMDVSDATDILEIVNQYGQDLPTLQDRSAFADLMIEILLNSNHAVKQYLGVLSQGYFAYHALALDQDCSDERLKLAKAKTWIIDSSVMLALLAINSLNYDYAHDLLHKMKESGLQLTTTERLLSELRDHAYWAIANFANEPLDSPRLLLAAQAGLGYKQNLFIDGFTKWSVSQGNPRLDTYLTECLGSDYTKNLSEAIKIQVQSFGIEVREFADWPNFTEQLFHERDLISQTIAVSRKNTNTYTGTDQCDAEAEIVLVSKLIEARFLSQSSFLNQYTSVTIVWKPESMFRFLTLFSSVPSSNDMLYQCMTQDFYYAGFDIIDQQTIANYASPLIHQARMKLADQRSEYEKILGKDRVAKLATEFEQTPDIQKPFYAMQFAFYVASQAEALRKVAVKRATRAEQEAELTQKERAQYKRLKAKYAQRKRKTTQAKRRKQSQQSKKKRK